MKTESLPSPLKNPPLVMGMHIEMRWKQGWRCMKPQGCQFRLYRPAQRKDGAWILKKCREYRWFKFRAKWSRDWNGQWGQDTSVGFKERMRKWGEKKCEEKGWVFDPEATHNHKVEQMDESFKLLLEMEIVAQRGR